MFKEIGRSYNKLAKRYSRQVYENFWNNLLEYPVTVVEIKNLNLKGKKVLDVGCGSGRYTKILLKSGAEVWGIDASQKMIEIAKQDVKGAQFSVCSAEKTKFKSGFFDVIFSGLVLEYLDRSKFFREANRILKNGGVLLFSMHNPYTETGQRAFEGKEIFSFKNYFKEGNFYKHWPNFKACMRFRHVTMQTTIRSILKNGFIIEDLVDIKPPVWSRRKFRKDYDRVVMLPPFIIMKLKKAGGSKISTRI